MSFGRIRNIYNSPHNQAKGINSQRLKSELQKGLRNFSINELSFLAEIENIGSNRTQVIQSLEDLRASGDDTHHLILALCYLKLAWGMDQSDTLDGLLPLSEESGILQTLSQLLSQMRNQHSGSGSLAESQEQEVLFAQLVEKSFLCKARLELPEIRYDRSNVSLSSYDLLLAYQRHTEYGWGSYQKHLVLSTIETYCDDTEAKQLLTIAMEEVDQGIENSNSSVLSVPPEVLFQFAVLKHISTHVQPGQNQSWLDAVQLAKRLFSLLRNEELWPTREYFAKQFISTSDVHDLLKLLALSSLDKPKALMLADEYPDLRRQVEQKWQVLNQHNDLNHYFGRLRASQDLTVIEAMDEYVQLAPVREDGSGGFVLDSNGEVEMAYARDELDYLLCTANHESQSELANIVSNANTEGRNELEKLLYQVEHVKDLDSVSTIERILPNGASLVRKQDYLNRVSCLNSEAAVDTSLPPKYQIPVTYIDRDASHVEVNTHMVIRGVFLPLFLEQNDQILEDSQLFRDFVKHNVLQFLMHDTDESKAIASRFIRIYLYHQGGVEMLSALIETISPEQTERFMLALSMLQQSPVRQLYQSRIDTIYQRLGQRVEQGSAVSDRRMLSLSGEEDPELVLAIQVSLADQGLAAITIPESITSTSDSVFSRCESLTAITIPEELSSASQQRMNTSGSQQTGQEESRRSAPDSQPQPAKKRWFSLVVSITAAVFAIAALCIPGLPQVAVIVATIIMFSVSVFFAVDFFFPDWLKRSPLPSTPKAWSNSSSDELGLSNDTSVAFNNRSARSSAEPTDSPQMSTGL
ncbi:MAG: hypothetical protein VXW87_03305 [Pseudomonadota bacterium]|nr:hypothetical protein [Pseudomonadota bacterium]